MRTDDFATTWAMGEIELLQMASKGCLTAHPRALLEVYQSTRLYDILKYYCIGIMIY